MYIALQIIVSVYDFKKYNAFTILKKKLLYIPSHSFHINKVWCSLHVHVERLRVTQGIHIHVICNYRPTAQLRASKRVQPIFSEIVMQFCPKFTDLSQQQQQKLKCFCFQKVAIHCQIYHPTQSFANHAIQRNKEIRCKKDLLTL